jgi:hypothetical protein
VRLYYFTYYSNTAIQSTGRRFVLFFATETIISMFVKTIWSVAIFFISIKIFRRELILILVIFVFLIRHVDYDLGKWQICSSKIVFLNFFTIQNNY